MKAIMLDTEILSSVAKQMMTSKAVEIDGHKYQAIEQNPEKPSRWAELARRGHQVVQFKDSETNRFVAVSVDGKVTVYGAGYRDTR